MHQQCRFHTTKPPFFLEVFKFHSCTFYIGFLRLSIHSAHLFPSLPVWLFVCHETGARVQKFASFGSYDGSSLDGSNQSFWGWDVLVAKFRVVDDWFVSGASTCWKVNGTTAVFEGTRDFFSVLKSATYNHPWRIRFLKINAFYIGKQLIVARCPSVHHFAVMDVSSFFALAHESRAHKILHPQDIAWKCGHAKMKDLRAAHNNFRSVFFHAVRFRSLPVLVSSPPHTTTA